MEIKNKAKLAIVIGCSSFFLAGAVFALAGRPVNVLAFNKKNVDAPLTITLSNGDTPVIINPQSLFSAQAPTSERSFGATPTDQITNWTGGAFSGDLTVGGTLGVTGATTLSSTLNVTATTTLAGAVVISGAISGNVPNTSIITQSNATTTPCAVQNTSGSTRTLLAIGVKESSTPGAGAIGLNVGTSTTAFVTSTSPFINNGVFANSASQEVISTTSSLMTAYAPWKNNEWLVWKTVSSTNAGNCEALYY